MTEHTTPDLTPYRLIHRALRQAPHQLAAAATELDPADRQRTKAFARYWKGFSGEVLTHHTIEDVTFFPALVERVPVAVELIARTDADHHDLDELMSQAHAEVAGVARGADAAPLAATMRELADHMDEHLDFEDADILPLFERHFNAPEYDALHQQANKHLGFGRQAAFTIPFAAAVMTPEEFQDALGTAPLPIRALHRLTRPGFDRMTRTAFGTTAPVTAGVEGVL